MTWSDWYKASLALCMWREARGEGRDGMRAVGHVIRNRVEASHIPDDWPDVICRKWQFSSMTATNDSQLVKWPAKGDPQFDESMEIVDGVYLGTDFDLTNGATHYYADSIAAPSWAASMMQCAKIGHHIFFKNKTKAAAAVPPVE